MTQPRKPSAGALRAASKFARHSEHIYRWRSEPQDAERELAEIIDHETGMAELLEAAKEAKAHLEGGGNYAIRNSDAIDATILMLEQAIAKCEGKGSE